MSNKEEANEALVSRIQAGELEQLPKLWAQVERFVSQQAGKRARGLTGAVDFEDLYQSGYLAMVAAAESYSPTRGMSFIGWMVPHLKTAFRKATGTWSGRQERDPIHRATSLDRPLGTESEDTLGDLIAAPDSLQGFEEAEERIWREELHTALARALNSLPEGQGDTLRRRYFLGQTLEAIATTEGTSRENIRQREAKALRTLRHPRLSRPLRVFIEDRTPYYLHVGVSRFNTIGTSAVEEIAMRRERLLHNTSG